MVSGMVPYDTIPVTPLGPVQVSLTIRCWHCNSCFYAIQYCAIQYSYHCCRTGHGIVQYSTYHIVRNRLCYFFFEIQKSLVKNLT